MTYNHNGIIFRYNEDEILSFVAKWIGLDNVMLSEIARHKEISIAFSLWEQQSHSKVVVSLLGPESMMEEGKTGREEWMHMIYMF